MVDIKKIYFDLHIPPTNLYVIHTSSFLRRPQKNEKNHPLCFDAIQEKLNLFPNVVETLADQLE